MINLMEGIKEVNGELAISSREVAKKLNRRHDNMLRDLDKILENSNVRSLVMPSVYKVKGQLKEYKEYLLTKDGLTLYMFSTQGYVKEKLNYIKKFNEMEKALNKINDVLITEKDEKKVASKVKEVMAEHNNEMEILKGHFEFAKQMIEEQDKKIKTLDGVANLFSSMKDGQLPFSLTYEQARKINRASWKIMQDKKTIKPSDGVYYFKDKNGYTIPLPDKA